jgi:hypothetical protein
MSVADYAAFVREGPLSSTMRTAHLWRSLPNTLRFLIGAMMDPRPVDRWNIHEVCDFIRSVRPEAAKAAGL